MLELKNITKKYLMGDNVVYALDDVSFKIEAGDFVAIMGPSGSGKSTLMNIIGLLDVSTQGEYYFNDKKVSDFEEDALSVLRRRVIGFIFQQFNLLPRMSAMENVALPTLYSEKDLNLVNAKKLLKKVGLGDRGLHRSNELSGGQQQRVAIARSLINAPAIILADEPTGNLDSTSEAEIIKLLKELNESGITVIIVTHEEEIASHAKRIIRMRDGKIQSDERLSGFNKIINTTPVHEQVKNNTILRIKYLMKHFEQGIKTLLANKVRTILSMLGIMIGVAAVVAMLALGAGAQKAIEQQLSSLGSNLLMLRAGAVRGPGGAMSEAGATTTLTLEDSIAIKNQVSNINDVSPTVDGRVQLAYGNKNWNSRATGVLPAYTKLRASTPDIGRFFTLQEDAQRQRVALLGRTVVRELFGNSSPVGTVIKINRINFSVIGVLPAKGSAGFRDQDDVVVIPLSTAMKRLLGKEYLDSIDIEVSEPEFLDDAQEQILNLMYARKKVPFSQRENAFTIRNMADIQNALSSSTKIMTVLLSIIAAISLIVGGIGIMNIMLVSVTERTKEIGLRKAVGARRKDIQVQFLSEAIVISVVGGALGIFLAWLTTISLSIFAGWTTNINVNSVMMAFGFSVSVGLIFGLYPAIKASKLHPIQALRYE